MQYKINLKKSQFSEIGSTTLVGSSGEFPRERGNCFSVMIDDKDVRIVNFVHENLEHLIKSGKLSYPIDVLHLDDRHAIIHDSRIPDDWYQKDFCAVCCPYDLLPLPQKLEFLRKIDRGDIEIKNGFIIEKMFTTKPRKLKGKWTISMKNDVDTNSTREKTTANKQQLLADFGFDSDGYPTDKMLEAIKNWSWQDGYKDLLDAIKPYWNFADMEYWHIEGDSYFLSTAGWSGNEKIIDALKTNSMFWMSCWYSSKRGGHFEFRLPEAERQK